MEALPEAASLLPFAAADAAGANTAAASALARWLLTGRAAAEAWALRLVCVPLRSCRCSSSGSACRQAMFCSATTCVIHFWRWGAKQSAPNSSAVRQVAASTAFGDSIWTDRGHQLGSPPV